VIGTHHIILFASQQTFFWWRKLAIPLSVFSVVLTKEFTSNSMPTKLLQHYSIVRKIKKKSEQHVSTDHVGQVGR
jgi:hypothetical protein